MGNPNRTPASSAQLQAPQDQEAAWRGEMLDLARAAVVELGAIRTLLERVPAGQSAPPRKLRKEDLQALELALPAIRQQFGAARFGSASAVEALAKLPRSSLREMSPRRLGRLLARAAEAEPVGTLAVRRSGQDAAGALWSVEPAADRGGWGQLTKGNAKATERQQ